jgi:hypothetical protein
MNFDESLQSGFHQKVSSMTGHWPDMTTRFGHGVIADRSPMTGSIGYAVGGRVDIDRAVCADYRSVVSRHTGMAGRRTNSRRPGRGTWWGRERDMRRFEQL